MGKRGKKIVWKRRRLERSENTGERRNWDNQELIRDNEDFVRYYRAQNIVQSEEEWEQFMQSMKTGLPISFRITGTRKQAQELQQLIENEIKPLMENVMPQVEDAIKAEDESEGKGKDEGESESAVKVEVEGQNGEEKKAMVGRSGPQPIEWYPYKGLAYTFDIGRRELKRSKELNDFHKFLVTETEIGNISRQEEVSMIPPLLLDVKPNHAVLDLCAAPGSKTAQLLELIHNDRDNVGDNEIPEGIVVANDANYKRACMLVRQTNRLCSPSLVVTNHSGERFPTLNIYTNVDGSSDNGGSKKGKRKYQFDRVLADVPCSGDGTLRKNLGIWNTWKFKEANNLHKIQVRLLTRAVHLTKPGGKIVYSTCSLNPIENEAVIATVLNMFGQDTLQLLDEAPKRLPKLKRNSGLGSWKVFNNDGFEVTERQDENGDEKEQYKTFFPPKNIEELGIEKCVRILPHLQNTGGFFVAVLQKLESSKDSENNVESQDEVKSEVEQENNVKPETEMELDSSAEIKDVTEEGDIKQELENPPVDPALLENPFTFLEVGQDTTLKRILEYYGIIAKDSDCGGDSSNSNEKLNKGAFLIRTEDSQKENTSQDNADEKNEEISEEKNDEKGEKKGKGFNSIYFVTQKVKQLLTASKNSANLRVVNTGVKLFAKPPSKDSGFEFRLASEGIPLFLQLLFNSGDSNSHVESGEKRTVVMEIKDIADFKALLLLKNPRFDQLGDQDLISRIKSVTLPQTSLVVYHNHVNSNGTHSLIHLPVWRGVNSLSLHINKNILRSIMFRVFGFNSDIAKDANFSLDNNKRSQ
ncbi:tRNA (cytosine(34)-C(5))-methyltransferase [Zancudomyces culisetae]|uniref:tRNA (Cytosine(34)-C(5))-methyltransferase n=1 Tax=Zancudomyces culisetae TaxID=1213189 RepID=A0A1R1PHW2_ZANCU|nr:tRNA (cytosine(34)-C(5))-methyltransferase [Zancudomyces culisetae]|eukprot:OMH80537.1 tRNA (cytosine(34)-C(5))-methyltransferase [Zancudomyces culisetae]